MIVAFKADFRRSSWRIRSGPRSHRLCSTGLRIVGPIDPIATKGSRWRWCYGLYLLLRRNIWSGESWRANDQGRGGLMGSSRADFRSPSGSSQRWRGAAGAMLSIIFPTLAADQPGFPASRSDLRARGLAGPGSAGGRLALGIIESSARLYIDRASLTLSFSRDTDVIVRADRPDRQEGLQ